MTNEPVTLSAETVAAMKKYGHNMKLSWSRADCEWLAFFTPANEVSYKFADHPNEAVRLLVEKLEGK